MRRFIAALSGFIFYFSLTGCGPDHIKSANELEYDSLTTVIKKGLPFFRKSILTVPPAEGKDSALMMWDDLEHLDYPAMQEKYNLKDSASEREFLNALTLSAEVAAEQERIEEMLRRISNY
jgi:hypothetical protein